jgi:hypothetical protein
MWCDPAGVLCPLQQMAHSLASLLIAEQRNPAEIAAQMGHTLQTLFSEYTGVIEDLRGRKPVNPEHEINAAKAKAARNDVAQKLPKRTDVAAQKVLRKTKNPGRAGLSQRAL